MATDTAKEYAAREDKAARWSGYFHKFGITAAQVQQMALVRPEWKQLAKAISLESGRKLNAPNHQETIDAIVRHLGYYEESK